jgi:hypothetical protein
LQYGQSGAVGATGAAAGVVGLAQGQAGVTGRGDATRRKERAALMLRLQQYLGGQREG